MHEVYMYIMFAILFDTCTWWNIQIKIGTNTESYDLYCSETDICKISCDSVNACRLMNLYCYGTCYIKCDNSSGIHCPNVIAGNWSYWETNEPTVFPTNIPSTFPSMPTINPSIYPTIKPSIYPSTIPSNIPTFPSFNPLALSQSAINPSIGSPIFIPVVALQWGSQPDFV